MLLGSFLLSGYSLRFHLTLEQTTEIDFSSFFREAFYSLRSRSLRRSLLRLLLLREGDTRGERERPTPNLITWQPLRDLSKILTEND